MECRTVFVSSAMEVEETEEVAYITDFYLTSGSKHPSLMEVPFAIQKIPWDNPELGKIYVQGNCNGAYKVCVEIDMWKLELPSEGKPRFLVRQVTGTRQAAGAWMALRKPLDFYLETMKVVSVAAHFLTFAKRSPNASKGDVWRYLRKECSEYKVKPNQKDLIQSFLLCRTIVMSDPKLQQSPILSQFFPTLSMKRGAQVAQVSDDSRRRLSVKEERSDVPEIPTSEGDYSCEETHSVVTPVIEILSLGSVQRTHRSAECEASSGAADILRGETSLQSTPKTHSLARLEASPVAADILRGETSLQSTPKMHRPARLEASPLAADISKGGPSLESAQRTHRSAECEASPGAADILRGETSLQSTPKTHSLARPEAFPLAADISKGGPSLESAQRTCRSAECEASPIAADILRGETSLQPAQRTHRSPECEASPIAADFLRGETSLQSAPKTHRPADCETSTVIADVIADFRRESSLQPTPRTRSLSDFGTTRSLSDFGTDSNLRVSRRHTSDLKKRKRGRPPRRSPPRRNVQKRKKETDKSSVVGNGDWIDEPDVCAFCDDGVEKGDELLCCDGPCMRSFHPTVESGRENKCPGLCLTRAAVSAETWICPNCEAGQHQCFACGKLGNSTTSTGSQEVFECGAKQCKRFYHPVCVAKLLVPDLLVAKLLVAERNDLACRIQADLEPFTCPLHNCASCNLEEDKTDPSLCLIKCRRCPVAWHMKCLPEVCRGQLWSLEGDKYVMYCGRHILDPELQTPKRDHVIFPAVTSVVNPSPSGGPHHQRTYETTVTLESVKKKMGIFSTT